MYTVQAITKAILQLNSTSITDTVWRYCVMLPICLILCMGREGIHSMITSHVFSYSFVAINSLYLGLKRYLSFS